MVKITELHPDDSVERELMLVTVRAEPGTRGQVIELVQVFEGRILDVGHDELTVELAGPPSKLDDFEDLMRGYGIVELQRTGRVALAQGRSASSSTARRWPPPLGWYTGPKPAFDATRTTRRGLRPWRTSTTRRTPTPR